MTTLSIFKKSNKQKKYPKQNETTQKKKPTLTSKATIIILYSHPTNQKKKLKQHSEKTLKPVSNIEIQ